VSRHHQPESGMAARVRALEESLTAKGLVDPAALDALVELYEHKIGPRNGARVVARAWCDPRFRARLREDAGAACAAEFNFGGRQGEDLALLENTPQVHNMVVCTLCSCYPWPLLGLPPVWYKSAPYRARAVREPRAVLAEFSLTLAPRVEVRVWDSTAELRYLVLPMRPPESAGLDEESLARWVTRDSMIGVGLPRAPAPSSP